MNTEFLQILPLQYDNGISVNTINLTVEDFDKICRTCLQRGEMKPIFKLNDENIAIHDVLSACASLQIHENDSLPQNICTTCLQQLQQIQNFNNCCQQSETILREILKSHKQEVRLENDLMKQELENNDKDETDLDESGNVSEDSDIIIKKSKRIVRESVRLRFKTNVYGKHQKSPYKCRDCNEKYETRDELREHRKTAKHPEIRNHACDICSKMFTSSKLRQHMRAHTKEKPYKCNVCLQGFSMSGNLKRHMMTHTGERPHVCEVCGKGFIQATSLQCHRKTHTSDERIGPADSPKFICDYCGRGFKRLAPYNLHLRKHYSENGTSDIKKVSQTEDPREHVCEICKRAYKTKHLLKAHHLTHGEKSFLCSDCGKGFVTKAALLSHLKVHTGEKPHTCNVCKKSFAHVGSFDAHMLIHTGQKPYNCTICTKAFTQLSHLKYHLRTHSGERPYSCSFCGKSFALKGNLTVHVRTHTGETPYLCPVCGKGFYDSSSMKKHRRGHREINVHSNNLSANMINIPVTVMTT